ncbi:MAG TPA: hypothetical protein VMD09_00800 [Solirubrobacteraceae bacterium]|nr:hypothetical protein [Solirubrobacteraceae bacterium]
MTERDPHELSEELEEKADALEHQGQEVKDAVDETREGWERKRRDDNIPGAPPPEGNEPEGSGSSNDV